MHGQKTGKGQIYMATYKDKDGDWLDDGTNYVLRLPPDVPAETFWSITVYEVSTRTLINNKHEIADRSSRMDLLVNKDGSVDLYIGPDKPRGDKAKNWIPTEAGRAWFPISASIHQRRHFSIGHGCCRILKKPDESLTSPAGNYHRLFSPGLIE